MYGEGWRAPPTDAVLNRISQEFDYADLLEATCHFSAECLLGEGTYGTVFRGTLKDGTEVAIKTLASPKEGGFREEVEVLSRFRHPNLVILMGFARNGRERYLVYELLPGGDVNSRLNKDAGFTWQPRLNVVLDAALGLSHLHGSRPQVFHRDVKTQNILMDRNGTGKVADFGLARLSQANKRSLAVQQTSGTLGYADPLYIRTGVVTEKSEVYSLGMVLLEVLTGRPPALQHANGRIEYQFEHINGDQRRLHQMVDRRGQWPPAMAERVGTLALQCTCAQEAFRPSFVEIVTQLRQWLRENVAHPLAQPLPAGPPSSPPQEAAPQQRRGAAAAASPAGRDWAAAAGGHGDMLFGCAGRGPLAAESIAQAQAAHSASARGGYCRDLAGNPPAYGGAAPHHVQPPWPQAPAPMPAAHHQTPEAERQPPRAPSPRHQFGGSGVSAVAAPTASPRQQHPVQPDQPTNPFAVGGATAAVAARRSGSTGGPIPLGDACAWEHRRDAWPQPAGFAMAHAQRQLPGAPAPWQPQAAGPSQNHGAMVANSRSHAPVEQFRGEAEPLLGAREPPASRAITEADIAKLVEMGYERHVAEEAFLRCSTLEAAVEWILTRGDD